MSSVRPSHLRGPNNTKARPDDVTDVDIEANNLADTYAATAATMHQVSLQTATNCQYYYNLTRKIQHRLIAIMQNLPMRVKRKTVRTPAEEQVSLAQKSRESNHAVVISGCRAKCTACFDSFRIKDPAFQP